MREEEWAPITPMRDRSRLRLLNDVKLSLVLVGKIEPSGILKELIAQSTELFAVHVHQSNTLTAILPVHLERTMTDTPANSSTCLLLTATITVKEDVVFTARKDTNARLNDYKRALNLWLAHPATKSLVLVENSGSDLSELREIANQTPQKNVEFFILHQSRVRWVPRQRLR